MGIGLKVVINTDQLDLITAQLDGMDNFIADMSSSAIDDLAELAVPIRTGNLAASLGIFLQGNTWINYAKAGYAYFVEMGTRYMGSQSYLRVAIPAVNWIEIVIQAARMIGL